MSRPSDLRVRPAVEADVPVLCSFQQAMAAETEDKVLDAEPLERGVRGMLEDPGRGRYLVAERGGVVVGCLALTREWSDWRGEWFWWIQSVYVAAEARRTGVFGALYRGVQAEARAAGDVRGIRLYVETENLGAQAVYEGLGMTRSGYWMYDGGLD